MIASGSFNETNGVDSSYACHMKSFMQFTHDNHSNPGVIDYLDFDAYAKFLYTNRREGETWFINRDFLRHYYEDMVPFLNTGPGSLDKVKFSIQHMINFELYDKAKNCFADSYFELSKDNEMKRLISHAKSKHRINHINKMKAKNKEVINPKTLIKKSL